MKQNKKERGKSSGSNKTNLENKWNQRFYLDKMPKYDSHKDVHFLSLGLIRAKLRNNENQLKEFKKHIKKSKTNSSRLTLESKKNKNLNIPFLVSNTDNEKRDLFSLKCGGNDNILTITGQNSVITEFNKKDIFKKMYDDIYNINTNKTEQNSRFIDMNNKFNEEMKEIKELWKILGVTPEYQINFWKLLSKNNNKEYIDKYLSYEKKDLIQLKLDLEKLKKEIFKRENDLNKLKQINSKYSNNENIYNIYNNMSQKNIMEENEKEQLCKCKENKINIEIELENLLKSLRLHTINTVCLFSKFKNQYNYYFSSGKIDINQMHKGYEFNTNYLIKIKYDTNFLKDSSFTTIYDFSKFENDPFFLSLLSNKEENSQFKYLTATEDTLDKINQCMYIIDQEEILYKIEQNKLYTNKKEVKKTSYVKISPNLIGTNLKKEIQTLNRKKIKNLLFDQTNQVIPLIKQAPLFNKTLTENYNNNKTKKISKI